MGIPQQKEYWDINRLRPWDKNPRAIKEEDFIRLKKQIQDLGEYKPLVITSDGVVLGGNMRLRALKDLAFDKVWVSIVEPKDEKEMIQYALSDNDRAGYYVEVELAELLLTSNIPQDFFKDYKVDLGHTVDLADFISQYSPHHRMFEPCLHGWKKGKAAYFNKKISAWGDVWNLTKEDILEELDLRRQTRDSKYDHPTQKPVKLAEKGIKKSSKMGAIVLDIFGGSGSTLIACEQLYRKCYMAELDPKYCDVIRKRFSKFIGKEEQWLTETPLVS